MKEWQVLSEDYAEYSIFRVFIALFYIFMVYLDVSIGMCRVQKLEYSILRVFVVLRGSPGSTA